MSRKRKTPCQPQLVNVNSYFVSRPVLVYVYSNVRFLKDGGNKKCFTEQGPKKIARDASEIH